MQNQFFFFFFFFFFFVLLFMKLPFFVNDIFCFFCFLVLKFDVFSIILWDKESKKYIKIEKMTQIKWLLRSHFKNIILIIMWLNPWNLTLLALFQREIEGIYVHFWWRHDDVIIDFFGHLIKIYSNPKAHDNMNWR